MASSEALDACRAQYEIDVASQGSCGAIALITEEHRRCNREVFEALCQMQLNIIQKGSLPYTASSGSTSKEGPYPDHVHVNHYRELKQILPIPDIHQVSDCDTIYRNLMAKNFDIKQAIESVLHYIAFRLKYDLNNILWDREIETMFNGLDGEDLLQEVMDNIANKGGPQQVIRKNTKVVPRLPLQAGWAAWNNGIDKTGHVIFYQRPNAKELAQLEHRYRYIHGAYDRRNPNLSVTAPYSNLLVRLHLRNIEKGRRLSRLLNYNKQQILREVFGLPTTARHADRNAFTDNGGGITCLVDFGCVKVTQLMSPKCKEGYKLFHLLSLLGQCYYPDNMNIMIIINAGLAFTILFKMVKGWLDPATQKKIVILSATNKQSVEKMAALEVAATNSWTMMSSPTSSCTNDTPSKTSHDSTPIASSVVKNKDFALHHELLTYMDDRYIPSWYGGAQQVVEAPLCYGGRMPKHLSDNPCYNLAAQMSKAKVVPELLDDAFVFNHAKEGMPIGEAEWTAFVAQKGFPLSRK